MNPEIMTESTSEPLPRIPLGRMIGGLLLAFYLPPIFAIAILRRWTSVPRWLRACSITFAFLTAAIVVWYALMLQPVLEAALPLCVCLTWTFFALSYMRERRTRASLLLKLGTAFIYLVILSGIVLFGLHRFWLTPRIRLETCMNAACQGDTIQVASLLDEGVDINAFDGNRGTFLIYASLEGHNETVRLLLDRGADPNLGGKNNVMPLQLAARRSHLEATRLLLSAGADVNSRNDYGWTALHYAAQTGGMDTLRLLLEHRADKSTKDNEGKTPVDIAHLEGHAEAAELIDNGLPSSVQ